MDYAELRDKYPCPDCGVDQVEYCLSKKGERMFRFIHPNRRLASKTTYEETIKLRNWLASHAEIFQEAA